MSDIKADAPSIVDDDGTGRFGTRADAAWYDDLLDAINIQTLSAVSPAKTPVDAIDAVEAAKGACASLDARLDVSLNEDGTPKASAFTSYATVTQLLGGLGGVNLITNDDYEVWCAGDTSAPTGDTLAGAGAAVQRCGTGLADVNRKIGDFCARVTRAGADCALNRSIISGAAFTRAGFLPGLYAAFGCWVKCSTPNVARLAIYDGVGTTYSSFHTGGGAWEFLAVTRQINIAADQILLYWQVSNANVAAYFSGRSLVLLDGNLSLTRYIPMNSETYAAMHFAVAGNLSVGPRVGAFEPARMGIVRDVQAHLKTTSAGADVIIDVNTWDGASQTSMFATRPTIAAGATEGGARPDTTYARRCFTGQFGSPAVVGGRITLDIDQVGAPGTTGVDLGVEIRALQYKDPLEKFKDYTG